MPRTEVVIPERFDGADVDKWLEQLEPETHAKLYPGKHYTINTPLGCVSKPGLTFDGNHPTGTTIHREDAGWSLPNPRTNAHLRFDRCAGLVVQNVKVIGPNTGGGLADGAYVRELEAQHGIDIIECSWFHLHDNMFSDVYGDIIYVGGRSNRPSQIFRINNNLGTRTGRQGIAVCNAKHGFVENNQLWQIRRSMFDAEPIDETWVVENVTFQRNNTGSCRGYWFAALGEGPIHDLTIQDNTTSDYLELVLDNTASRNPQPRSNVKVLRNRSSRPSYGTPSGKVQKYVNVEGVTVRDNFQHSQARVVDFARFAGCTNIDYGNNTIRTLP